MADRVVYCQRPAGALLERGDTNGEALHVDPLQIVLAGDGLGQRRCPAALTLPIQNRPSSRIEAVSESRESGPKACSSRVRVEENSAESLLRKNQPDSRHTYRPATHHCEVSVVYRLYSSMSRLANPGGLRQNILRTLSLPLPAKAPPRRGAWRLNPG